MNLKISRLKIWLRVLRSFLATFPGVKCNILTAEETVRRIRNGKSLIRFGDGEFGIYSGRDIHYQKWSKNLHDDFLRIKKCYEKAPEACPYLLSVPRLYMSCSGMRLARKRVLVSSWSEARDCFRKHFRREDIEYGDAFLFEKKNREIYARLWPEEEGTEDIIFVHNNERYAAQFARQYCRRVHFVRVPPRDAYEEIEMIYDEIMKVIADNNWNDPTAFQVVISAGPAGKVLVYRLSAQNIHCIDAGHCWDEPLES